MNPHRNIPGGMDDLAAPGTGAAPAPPAAGPPGALHLLSAERVARGPGIWHQPPRRRHRALIALPGTRLVATIRRGRARHEVDMGPDGLVLSRAHLAETWTLAAPLRAVALRIDPIAAERFAAEQLHVLALGRRIDLGVAVAHARLARTAHDLMRTMEAPGIGGDVILDALARIFLATLVRDLGDPDGLGATTRLDGKRLRRVVVFVKANFNRRLYVAEIAREVGLSESALRSALREGLGMSPMDLVARIRAAEARRLIASGAENFGEVAAACGYADQAHLSRSFRRTFGQSPSAWRATLRRT